MDTENKYRGKVVLLVLFIISILLIIGLIFIKKIPNQTILEYGKIIISYPGAIIFVSILTLFIIIYLHSGKESIIIYEKDPDITGFINIKKKTDDGNLVIELKENYKIKNGDAVVAYSG